MIVIKKITEKQATNNTNTTNVWYVDLIRKKIYPENKTKMQNSV